MKNRWLILVAAVTQIGSYTAPVSVLGETACKAEGVQLNQVSTKSHSEVSMNQFVSDLMSRMTLEEKIGQLNLLSIGSDVTGPVLSQSVEDKIEKGSVGAVLNIYGPEPVRKLQQMAVEKSRLKIPLIFGYDVVHGHRTIFPIPLAMSCSWNLPLIKESAQAAASEASADGINWVYSPMVDITRDPRWGRVMEGAGEDPYLGSAIASAMVEGYQGVTQKENSLISSDRVMACVKHFALYGAAEAGRDYNTVDMSRQKMFNEYLPPYKAAVDAGVGSVMTSFNEIDGMPASGNKWLMTGLLRKQWGFEGFVVTDYTAIPEMIAHGVGDELKVTELALNAGSDMDMVGELYTKHAANLFKNKRVSLNDIDGSCRRILQAKYKLGLFENPYRYIDQARHDKEILSPEKLVLSKKMAAESCVLLKNSDNVLPLNKEQKIAFIGPLVKDQHNLIGSWSAAGNSDEVTSIWSALQAKFGANKFSYAKGCNLLDDANLRERLNRDGARLEVDSKTPQELQDEACELARQSDKVVVVVGEPSSMSGEASCRSMIGLLENQLDLLKALKKTGKPIVLVLMNGRPLTLAWEDKNIDAILETWFAGTQAGPAIVDLLFGEANPSGKLTMSFPQNVGQIPIHYNQKNTGRPLITAGKYFSQYLDVSNEPLYPFGYGLSYSKFKYDDFKLDKTQLTKDDVIKASVTITNTSKFDGNEIVQLYIRDMVGSITRPVKELKGFRKIFFKGNESKTVTFKITTDDLRFYDNDFKFVAEPGDFEVYIGSNSRDLSTAKFQLTQ